MNRKTCCCWFFVFLSAFIIVGCAARIPLARPEATDAALKSSPAKGKALIYVLRKKEFACSAGTVKFYLNNNYWGDVARATFLAAQVEPGDHVLAAEIIAGMGGPPERAGKYRLTVSSGERYFIMHHCPGGPPGQLMRLSNVAADNMIRNFALSAVNNLAYTLEPGAKDLPQPIKSVAAHEQRPMSAPITAYTKPQTIVPSTGVEAAAINFGAYHALVIGNNEYRHLPHLRTAVDDAMAMAALLREKYGFDVKLILNATRADILRTINGYRQSLGPDDNLLIYYAGHGWLDEDADQGYWLPVDAAGQDPTNWISNGSITDCLRAIAAKHVLVIADSCYSGKLARGVHVGVRGRDYYKKISQKKARTVMASGGLEPVADEGGKGRHSVFTSSLMEALNKNRNIVDATSLFSQIRRPVMLNSDQTPEYSDIRKAGHDGGDFLFVREK